LIFHLAGEDSGGVADDAVVIAGDVGGGGVAEELCMGGAEGEGSPHDRSEGAATASKTLALLLNLKNGEGIELLHLAEELGIVLVGDRLGVKMGQVGAGDENGGTTPKDNSEGFTQQASGGGAGIADHEGEEAETLGEDALEEGKLDLEGVLGVITQVG